MNRDNRSLESQFYSPLNNVFIKGAEEDGKWIVYLQASNEMTDQEGETIKVSALKKASDYYLSHGILSWDHKHKQTSNPGFIIGEPMEVKFTPGGETLVKGFLYKKNDIAQKLWSNIESGAKKLGASIGGGILQKSDTKIEKVVWDETALTHKPVNDGTLGSVQVVPFAEFAKALMAGSGVDATQFSGGRALSPESLQGAPVDVLPYDIKKLEDDVRKSMKKHEITSLNDLTRFIHSRGFEYSVSEEIVNLLARKFLSGYNLKIKPV